MSETPGRAYLDRRLELLVSGDSDGLVDEGYNDDAELVGFDAVVKGKDALKEHFRQHLPMLGGVELKAVDKFVETDDTVFFQVTVVTGSWGEVTSFEGFVLRNGKADYHFTALK